MIKAILAATSMGGIGNRGTLPWPHNREDMQWFKQHTEGHVVVMGRNTWDDPKMPKPLPNRINVVLSKSNNYSGKGAADHTFADPDLAISFLQTEYVDKEVFIIGGDSVYKYFMPIIDKFYVTEIECDYTCDRHFDLTYVQKKYNNVKIHAHYNDPVPYTIKEYNI